MGFADEVERARRQQAAESEAAAAERRLAAETAQRNAAAVRALGEEVRDVLAGAGVAPSRAETLKWTTGGGPRNPAQRHAATVARGWRLGHNGGWVPLVTPEGILHSSWTGPRGRGIQFHSYSRPLVLGNMVRDGDYRQNGHFFLGREGHIMLYGDSETGDSDMNDAIARAVARLTS